MVSVDKLPEWALPEFGNQMRLGVGETDRTGVRWGPLGSVGVPKGPKGSEHHRRILRPPRLRNLVTETSVLSIQFSVLRTQFSGLIQISVLRTQYSELSTQYSVLSALY